MLKKINSFSKDFLLASRVGVLLSPLKNFFRFMGNFCDLSLWVHRQHKKVLFTDFYKPVRTYSDREKLYSHVSKLIDLQNRAIQYYEFGVASGASFRWWLKENKNPASEFYGFDTFEGLPEDWHFYKKGDMSFGIPQVDDERAHFFKGLFQDTVPGFIRETTPHNNAVKVLHMDADLYSSTLYVLTYFAPYLNEGDVIFFDEFNVPNHEFAAWNDFVRSYYVQYDVMGGVNNYYQTCFMYKGTKVEF
ncbi:MAG: class I SAM-dependent methyltransferase [Sphingobacteriales bacterium]|nr:MAG: class I SAM-dependent methyltransferase [Sphingobacteriales bacterium]